MSRFFGLHLLIAANFSLSFFGLLLPFSAIQADSQAPSTDDVRTFMFRLSVILIGTVLVVAFLAIVPYTRGSRGYLLAVSIVALLIPVASALTYRWYLFDVAHGTISGAVGFQLGVAAMAITALGAFELAIAGGIYLGRRSGRSYS